jgi:hypothetical protein
MSLIYQYGYGWYIVILHGSSTQYQSTRREKCGVESDRYQPKNKECIV